MTLDYMENVDQVIHVIMILLNERSFDLAHPAPTIFVSALGESSVKIIIYVWVPSRGWWPVKTSFPRQIKELFDRQRIEAQSRRRLSDSPALHIGSEIEGLS